MTQSVIDLNFRAVSLDDTEAILSLVNADRLAGQPAASAEMLTEALAGRSAQGSGWWAELGETTTHAGVTADGKIAGIVSFAVRPRDDTGLVLWMHSGEDPGATGAILDHALEQLGQRRIEAFPFATALGLGLEALPIAHRPVTHAALLQRGFTGTDLWQYLRAELRLPARPAAPMPAGEARRTLQIRENDRVVGEAEVGMPVQGIGVLWWIGLEPDARELDLEKALLGSALEFLAGVGAGEVIMFVASTEAADERLQKLYRQAGFAEVDRLYGFHRDVPDPSAQG